MGARGDPVVRGYYSERERPPMPCVVVRVYTPTRRRSIEVEAKVDTGFSGDLLLAIDEYLRLGLNLYESYEGALGVIAGGYSVELRASRAIVKLGGVEFECKVYTFPLATKSLLGRGILNRVRAVLDAPRGAVELYLNRARR